MTAKDKAPGGKAAVVRRRRAARRTPPAKSGGPPYTRAWLYPKQRETIFCKQRYAIVEASTKSGKTVGCMVWLLDQAWPERSKSGRETVAGPGARRKEEAQDQPPAPVRNYWWVAPVTAQAKIAYRRLKRVLPRGAFTAKETELTITLANESVVWFKGADDPDHLYGEDVYAAVIDEATRCKEEAWHAIRSTLTATRGPVRIIGNVKGTRNWAFRLARRAEAGERGMHYAKITAHDAVAARVIVRAEVEDARRTLPESVFRQFYLAEPADDEGNPFGITAVRGCIEAAPSDAEPVAGRMPTMGGPWRCESCRNTFRWGDDDIAQDLRASAPVPEVR